MRNIAILASGNGSNAQAIVEYFEKKGKNPVKVILSNKSDAFVHERAKKLNIPSYSFSRDEFYNSSKVLDILNEYSVEYIVLAGFLWLVPTYLTKSFEKRIINIHPALLPKYGGKGMYGMKVHESIVASKEVETGITIHYVNEEYDKGDIIFQARCEVDENDTPEMVAQKVHALEYEHFPKVIENIVS